MNDPRFGTGFFLKDSDKSVLVHGRAIQIDI